jgi:hypothetical protein
VILIHPTVWYGHYLVSQDNNKISLKVLYDRYAKNVKEEYVYILPDAES